MSNRLRIPKTPASKEELIKQLKATKTGDVDWRHGRGWSLVYYASDEHTDFLKEVYGLYFSENGLSPTAFPSLRKLETEVVAMILDLLGAESGVGTMTSGGTESILLAMLAYRERAREQQPDIKKPEILVPVSAHPAFLKAAAYFDLVAVPIPVDENFKVDISAVTEKLSKNTVCIVASAPSFPQGVVDPIPELGELAMNNGVGLHVDACLGGFMLPFIRQLGYKFPDFDFSVPGVTSISADLHKNGYAAKGASAVLYRDAELRRKQFFISADWPGGLYGSPTMAGTRPGGAIAAAWAAIMSLGMDGYLALAKNAMDTANELMEGISSIKGLNIIGKPDMTVFTFTSEDVDIFSVGDRMDAMGWRLDRQNNPDCLHMIATPNHKPVVEEFLDNLRKAVEEERQNPSARHSKEAMLYGVTANIGANADPHEVVLQGLDDAYSLDG